MTSYEFEKAAKNAVKKFLMVRYNIKTTIDKLELVWFAHEMGNKKCTIWGPSMGTMYAEVTYNKTTREMYVDIYTKIHKEVIPESDLKFEVES